MTSGCDIWVADLRPETAVDLAFLNEVESRRRAEYVFAADRARFTLGVVLSRRAVAAVLGIDPRAVDIDRSCPRCGAPHGKTLLPATGLHLSVSHSADLVAVSVTAAGPVGIDVERIDDPAPAGLHELLLGPGETAATPAAFYALWCRKESVVKATGEGMRVPLTSVNVADLGAQVSDLSLREGYAAALTVLGGEVVMPSIHFAA
ncbi:4'-phosphopantetheinyl transferase family protein [Subtercola lobariae]|uniref:4'-phosphopantetheinyl transferase n=1 Tax=Subtercola lobariae TaxID=1588641 RepID=A0A917B2N7_9MICO|nr:4'-phosphopantetheinyl transferase superfamily protein [Subtercola lobariae]GGF17510.1 4'-phosphopantetheinyl transferase [Subtercola lobariae]